MNRTIISTALLILLAGAIRPVAAQETNAAAAATNTVTNVENTNAPVAGASAEISRAVERPAALEAAMSAAAVAASAPNIGPDFSAFKIIGTRNIFNANRRPGRTNVQRDPRENRQSRVDSFSLKGVMSYDDEKLAFFDGTGSQFRGAFKPLGSIGGYRIAEIADDHVKLGAAADKSIELRVGMQMRRTDNGPWTLVLEPDASTNADASTSSSDATSTGTSDNSAAISGAVSEVMKRMMERRAKEEGGH